MNTHQVSEESARRQFRSRMIMLTVIAVAALVFLGIGYLLTSVEGSASKNLAQNGRLPQLGIIPPGAQFTERSGRKVSMADLKGTVWIADIIFTRCRTVCIMMSTVFRDIQKSIAKTPHVKLVSFTIDPEYDTPEKLADYANRYDADKDKWWFLTGDLKTTTDLVQGVMKLTAVKEGENPDPNQTLTHSRRMVLVDAAGQIRGYYDSGDSESSQKLLFDLRILLKQQQEMSGK